MHMQASINWNSLAAVLNARLAPTPAKMGLVADFLHRQVRDRFSTAGASGGIHWPPTVTPAGKRPPLDALQYTYRRRSGYGFAVVGSGDFRCYVAQLGNVVHNKLMFIPLTNVGVHFYWSMRSRSPAHPVLGGGHYFQERPTRIFGGHPGPAIEGVDYIWRMSKVDPPRPQLPTSDGERAALRGFVIQTLVA